MVFKSQITSSNFQKRVCYEFTNCYVEIVGILGVFELISLEVTLSKINDVIFSW